MFRLKEIYHFVGRWVYSLVVRRGDRVYINHPDIKYYNYYDKDHLLLYAVFQILVDYVEYECSIFGEKSWYDKLSSMYVLEYLLPLRRNKKAGRKLLEERMAIPENQWAKELLDLYDWWVDERPNRPDPWTSPELDKFHNEKVFGDDHIFRLSPGYKKVLMKAHKLEEQYQKEDKKQLLRLIKVSGHLWT